MPNSQGTLINSQFQDEKFTSIEYLWFLDGRQSANHGEAKFRLGKWRFSHRHSTLLAVENDWIMN